MKFPNLRSIKQGCDRQVSGGKDSEFKTQLGSERSRALRCPCAHHTSDLCQVQFQVFQDPSFLQQLKVANNSLSPLRVPFLGFQLSPARKFRPRVKVSLEVHILEINARKMRSNCKKMRKLKLGKATFPLWPSLGPSRPP